MNVCAYGIAQFEYFILNSVVSSMTFYDFIFHFRDFYVFRL